MVMFANEFIKNHKKFILLTRSFASALDNSGIYGVFWVELPPSKLRLDLRNIIKNG